MDGLRARLDLLLARLKGHPAGSLADQFGRMTLCLCIRIRRFVKLCLGNAFSVIRFYQEWNRSWLSNQVEHKIIEIRRSKKKRLKLAKGKMSQEEFCLHLLHYAFRAHAAGYRYCTRDFWIALKRFYLPSVATVVTALAFYLIFLLLGHHSASPGANTASATESDAPHVFEVLIVVVVALIVFVAESVRGSHNSDERKVLLKISNLWPLVLLITISPLLSVYQPSTLAISSLAFVVALVVVWGFGQVLRNLLDSNENLRAQRLFLKQRIRETVYYSAKERIGNKILYDSIGAGKEIAVSFTLGRSLLPGSERNYLFVDAPGRGTLADINLHELKLLGEFIEQRQAQRQPTAKPSLQTGETAAHPSPPQRDGNGETPHKQPYLLCRFKEELPAESLLARDRSVIAIPREVDSSPQFMSEITARVRRIFRFSADESPSVSFRHEMQSTKDRLIAAIRVGALGSIDDLRQTYLIVAEEFLEILDELGGGYSADQAREERGNLFDGWNEIHWLVSDVRELLIYAVATDNINIIGTIAFLPYAIATRAYFAGDNLLFQEFLEFGSFIYYLGAEKPLSSPSRQDLIDRSWRYLSELAQYQIQPNFGEQDDEE